MGLFLDTTQVAIKEMMEEFGAPSRFGRVFSEEDLEAAAARLASFFEMTLELRASVGLAGAPRAPAAPEAKPGAGRQGTGRPSYVRPDAASSAAGGNAGGSFGRGNALLPPPRRTGLGLSAGFLEPSLDATTEKSPGLLGRLGFPRTKAAAEVVAQVAIAPVEAAREDPRLPPQQDFRLPRKRVGVTEADRDAYERARKG